MARKVASESKRGLVVTIVFLVLIIIGLGLAAYYGFSDKEKLTAAAKAAESKAKLASDERDWYRFQIAVMLPYIDKPADANSPIGRELPNKAAFDGGNYPSKDVANIEAVKQEMPALKALIAKLNQRSPWDNAKNAPRETLEAVIKARETENDDLKKQRDKAAFDSAVAKKDKERSEAALQKEKEDFLAALNTLKEEFKKDRNGYKDRIAKLEDDLKKVEDKKDDKFIKPIADERDRLAKEVKRLNDQIKGLDDKILTLTNKVAATATTTAAREGAGEGKHHDLTPRGTIVRISPSNSRKGIIDLGRIHGLTAQTTFSVHGYQPNGKPKQRSKANIEVINVGERTSDVLVTTVFHPDPNTDFVIQGKRKEIDVLDAANTDPIVPGDALINPLWNPNSKTRIAIAGMIDLTGAGPTNLAGFIQMLERQNIIVDAYVDPADGTIKGRGLTRGTEYLLLGTKGVSRGVVGREEDPAVKVFNDNMDKLINEAKGYSIPVMQPKTFLRETGFTLPRTVSTD